MSLREKLTQVYSYLYELYKLRNPVIYDFSDHLGFKKLTGLPQHNDLSVCINTDEVSDFILKVRRPKLQNPPEPPTEIREWLREGWKKFGGKVVIIDVQRNDSSDDQIVRFEDDPSRIECFNKWKASYDEWTENERPARDTLKLYEDLYELKSRIDRESESYELILGDGLLDWPISNGIRIRHPILLQRVRLEFNPTIPEISIVETEQGPEFYTAIFSSFTQMDATIVRNIRQTVEQNDFGPKNGESTSTFLRGISSQIASGGEFIGDGQPDGTPNAPQIARSPLIFQRRKTLGLGLALQSILEDIPTREEFPSSITRIVGIAQTEQEIDEINIDQNLSDMIWPDEDEEVLFTKEANEEQLQIAQRLDKFGAVLVQGPPGTGKTHTIANLLGHLLAQGKSVLVTAHTEKALKVLRDKVVDPLRPLCVSALSDSRKQMEAAIDAIIDRLARSNIVQLEREAANLTEQRIRLIQELKRFRNELHEARKSEYQPLIVAGTSFDPSKAARLVKERENIDSWIPGPVAPGEPLPLSENEIIELYQSNLKVSPEDERAIDDNLPDPNMVISPSDFEEMVLERDRLAQTNLEYQKEYWANIPDTQSPEQLDNLLQKLLSACEVIKNSPKWLLSVIEAGKEGGNLATSWEDLLSRIKDADKIAADATSLFFQFNPSIPQSLLNGNCEKVLDDIIEHLSKGKTLGAIKLLLNKDWKEVIESTRINNNPPATIDDFSSLRTTVQFNQSRKALLERWLRQITSLGGPAPNDLGPDPERTCRQFIPIIQEKLDWYTGIWTPLKDELRSQGFEWERYLSSFPPDFSEHADLLRISRAIDKISETIEAQNNRLLFQQISNKWGENQKDLARIGDSFANSEVVNKLISSFKNSAMIAYRTAYERLVDLYTRRQHLERRRELLQKIDKVASSWAFSIKNRIGDHGRQEPPGPATSAWEWRQLHDELDRRAKISLEDIQSRINQLSKELKDRTAELVEKKAWAAQLRRTNLEQQQALNGWKNIMRRIGKGTGSRVPQLKAEARRLTPICQTAIPVWIMPLNQVAENFDPKKNRFDVIIIDEASQADAMAMTALYLGKKVVIVGDHEQVSPMAVGQNMGLVQNLISQHLNGIPNAIIYDGHMSIYDLAQASFAGMISLREHFRCVPQIINYSNRLSYEWKIKPLRDASNVKRRPPTIEYRVDGATIDGEKINKTEAHHIVSLVKACIEQPEYEDATFGIISMLGDDHKGQSGYISKLLAEIIPPTEIESRQIRCGNAYFFQGDERDIIFLSIVTTSTGVGPIRRLAEGTANDPYKKRYNVAASRAKDQLWVVHSLDPDNDLQPGDLRRDLILHARNPEDFNNQFQANAQHTESEFERLVLHRLMQAGYRVIPQWKVGAYRIDLVVEGGGKRIAIECDGDRFHPPENLQNDMMRQAILERLGWRFIRIRGSQFFRDPETALSPVFARLDSLGIPKEGNPENGIAENSDGSELKERIIRRAAEIRRELLEPDSNLRYMLVR